MRGGPDDTAGIGVPNHDDRPLGSVDGTIERVYVVAVTAIPARRKPVITRLQLDPSAQAPWTSTTVGEEVSGLMPDSLSVDGALTIVQIAAISSRT
jgi:hypothetical protein